VDTTEVAVFEEIMATTEAQISAKTKQVLDKLKPQLEVRLKSLKEEVEAAIDKFQHKKVLAQECRKEKRDRHGEITRFAQITQSFQHRVEQLAKDLENEKDKSTGGKASKGMGLKEDVTKLLSRLSQK
jgi:hypothetical protein